MKTPEPKELIESLKEGTIIPIYKDLNWTSFDVVKKIKSMFKLKKVGHAGSLDPKAKGLLLIATESRTKEINSLMDLEKEYEGIMRIGEETLSGDTETDVIKKYDISHITDDEIYSLTKNFSGEIEQIPPMHSAIKYKGRPLYKLARKGEIVERKPRKIFIHDFLITQINGPDVLFKIVCSKGTYIRSLVTDCAKILGVGAFLKSLTRLRIGKYTLDSAYTIDDLENLRSSFYLVRS